MRPLIASRIDRNTDFVFVIFNEDYPFGRISSGSAWTVAVDQLHPQSFQGVSYSAVPMGADFPPDEPLVNFITNEWGWQLFGAMKKGVTDVSGTKLYGFGESLPACRAKTGAVFPSFEHCRNDPDPKAR